VTDPEYFDMPIAIEWHGRSINIEATLAVRPLRPRFLLPLVQHITNAVTSLADAAVKDDGKSITCRAGCGACCRQLVPVTRSEAHNLREGMESLPAERRAVLEARFAEGKRRLADAGLLEKLEHADETADRVDLGRVYFRLGIACPFLEDESCSIHTDRPLACREYLVTTSAELCRSEHHGEISRVNLPVRTMPAFASLDGLPPNGDVHWMPLLLAPDWAAANPEPEASESGAVLFDRFVKGLKADQ
jgi:Fe-S-cluster containining protein